MDSPFRLSRLEVEGLRSLERVRLDLAVGHPTVLIGENASGKSSLLEALELLRLSAEPYFFKHLHQRHGGLAALCRVGAARLKLVAHLEAVDVTGGPPTALSYSLVLGSQGPYTRIEEEHLLQHPQNVAVLSRDASGATVTDASGQQRPWSIPADLLLLGQLGAADGGGTSPNPLISQAAACLRQIQVHLSMDVTPQWVGRQMNWESPLRRAVTVSPTDRLSLKGHNLVNALLALQQSHGSQWEATLELVRQGLGQDVEKILLRPDAGGGALGLWLQYADLAEAVPAVSLSDGTLSWLSLVALHQLARSGGGALAMDEPETHLHPGLLTRAVDLFEDLSRSQPVVLATHSDRLLDSLEDPAASVVVCELGEGRATRLRRLDPAALERWLE